MFEVKHDKQTAAFLRKLGFSHRQIAGYMKSSESWCRHNLADVKEDTELMHKGMYRLLACIGGTDD